MEKLFNFIIEGLKGKIFECIALIITSLIGSYLWNNNNINLLRSFILLSGILTLCTIHFFIEYKKITKLLDYYQNPPMTEKETLELKLLDYMQNNSKSFKRHIDIMHITNKVNNQIELIESLHNRGYITYSLFKYPDHPQSKDHFFIKECLVTLEGEEYLTNNLIKLRK